MICKTCRDAGAAARWAVDHQSDQTVLDGAMSKHDKCKGGTWCDCAHKVPFARPSGRSPQQE